MNQQILDLKEEWLNAKEQLNHFKSKEVELRKQLFSEVFEDHGGISQKSEDYGLKGSIPLNYKVDEAAYRSSQEKLRKEGIPDHLVKWKPEISITVMRQLPGRKAALLNECITMTHGLCRLETI